MIDKILKLVPKEPKAAAQYMYYLTLILFFGLIGYAAFAWYGFFTTWNLGSMFQGLFMLAGSLLTLTAVKQTKMSYDMMKVAYSQPKPQQEVKLESVDDMMGDFK